MMDDLEKERHILRAIYELQLIRDDSEYNKPVNIPEYELMDNIIESLVDKYPNIKDELLSEVWK